MTSTAYLPSYGFTEAISYNNAKLKDFPPVIVGQFSNKRDYPKAGVQYVHIKNNFLLFTWVVFEIKEKPNMDFNLLARYEPKLTEKLNLYTQLELVNLFPTESIMNYTFFQRVRLGIKIKTWQFVVSTDFKETGISNFVNAENIGVFLDKNFNSFF